MENKPVILHLEIHQLKDIARLLKEAEDKLREVRGKLETIKVQNEEH